MYLAIFIPFISRQGISSHVMEMDIGEEDWIIKEGAAVGEARQNEKIC